MSEQNKQAEEQEVKDVKLIVRTKRVIINFFFKSLFYHYYR